MLSKVAQREIAALKSMPDSEIDFSDMPRQDPKDPKWKNAVVGRFYRPTKTPVTVSLDSDIVAWLNPRTVLTRST